MCRCPPFTPGNVPVQVITDCDTPQGGGQPAGERDSASHGARSSSISLRPGERAETPLPRSMPSAADILAPRDPSAGPQLAARQGRRLFDFICHGLRRKLIRHLLAGVLPGGMVKVATAPFSITFGGVTLDCGAHPICRFFSTSAGLYQVDIQVPTGIADGDQPLVITVCGGASPANAFITVQEPASEDYSSRRISSGFWPRMRKLAIQPAALAI